MGQLKFTLEQHNAINILDNKVTIDLNDFNSDQEYNILESINSDVLFDFLNDKDEDYINELIFWIKSDDAYMLQTNSINEQIAIEYFMSNLCNITLEDLESIIAKKSGVVP